jgi:hypothetical protein
MCKHVSHPFNTGRLPLNYSDNPGVSVSHTKGGCQAMRVLDPDRGEAYTDEEVDYWMEEVDEDGAIRSRF